MSHHVDSGAGVSVAVALSGDGSTLTLRPLLLFCNAGASPSDIPRFYAADMMLPYPWSCTGKVVVVELSGVPMVVLGDFHTMVLDPKTNSPMPLSLDTLRTRLSRCKDASTVVVDKDNHPMVLAQLKRMSVLDAKVARTKLVSITTMHDVLVDAGQRADHVASIMKTYLQVVCPPANGSTMPAPVVAIPQSQPVQAPSPGAAPTWHAFNPPSNSPYTQPSGHVSSAQQHGSSALPATIPLQTSALAALGKRLASDGGSTDGMEHFQRDWPKVLPELVWTPKALREDYGFNTLFPNYMADPTIPLSSEVASLKDWCMDAVNLDRGLMYANPVKGVTFEGMLDTVHGVVGFMFKVSDE